MNLGLAVQESVDLFRISQLVLAGPGPRGLGEGENRSGG